MPSRNEAFLPPGDSRPTGEPGLLLPPNSEEELFPLRKLGLPLPLGGDEIAPCFPHWISEEAC